MKLLIASDIHGSAFYCRKLIEAFNREKADKLILLGDILYHGPRNDLPLEYAPKEVIAMLNEIKDDIMCIRGNCDTEVDQMVLDFSIMSEKALIYADGRTIHLAHGHKTDSKDMPGLKNGDYMISGHTHIPKVEEKDGVIFMNPGSVSIPKEGSCNSYMIADNMFYWKDLEVNIYMEYPVK